jgi:WD40 repeat protein/transcriptional regulator with XRE-family HTH domain
MEIDGNIYGERSTHFMTSQISKIALERFSNFGDLLKFLRRRNGITQRELALAVGYSHAQISRLELNQRVPDLATIAARFIPALELENETEVAERFIELAAAVPRETAPAEGEAPFKGLQFFDEEDAELFFGREGLTSRLVARMKDIISDSLSTRFLAVVGASGSGKSSIVRAGLIPALKRAAPFSRWLIRALTPTDRPLEALASSLNPQPDSVASAAALMDDLSREPRSAHLAATRLLEKDRSTARGREHKGVLLVIDQFEELFTLCRDEAERRAFVDNLMTAVSEPRGTLFVVLALRADFYNQCAPYPALRESLSTRQEYIGLMNAAELRRAIEEPAVRGGWELEPGLVELLLQDVGAETGHLPEPGALPLLSHALLETWRRRQGHKMTVSGYLASGGVRGAIAETADSVFQDELDEQEQTIARNIFLRLTQLGEGEQTADTRRRTSFDEFFRIPEEAASVQSVLRKLTDARLIITDNHMAEVAHEALIREWPTLRAWLEEDREGLRLHRHLTLATEGWERHARDAGELYRGARLAQAASWAETHVSQLNALEQDFLSASQSLAGQEEAEREAQRQRELNAARELAETQRQAAVQLRKRAIYLLGAFILTLIMAGVALYQGERVRQAAVTAQTERRIATARELAAASLNNLLVDPERSILLALKSVSTTRSVDGTILPESLEALHRAIVSSPIRMTLDGHGTKVLSAAYSPDGARLATIGDDGTVILWDTTTGEELLRLQGTTEPNEFVTTKRVAYSPDGKLLIATNKNQVKIYDPVSGNLVKTLDGHQTDVTAIAISADGRLIASGALDGSAIIWDADSGRSLFQLSAHTDPIENLTFSRDGKWLVTSGDDAAMRIWDTSNGNLLQEYADFSGVVFGVTFSPAGGRFAVSDGTIHVWQFSVNTTDGQTAISKQELFTIPDAASDTFSPDGSLLAGISGNVIKIWDAATGREALTLNGHTDWVMGLAFSPDGTQLASVSMDGTVKIWSLLPGAETVAVSSAPASFGTRVAFSSNGTMFATNGGDGSATLWDAQTGESRLTLQGHSMEVLSVAFSADGTHFATGSLDGTAILWDTATGKKLFTLTAHENGVRDLAFSLDGNLLASGGFDGTAKIWDVETGRLMREIAGHQGLVLGVAFSPDGTRLATSSTDATAKIWDVKSGELIFTLSGHSSGIRDLAYSPDGSLLATGSGDGTAILWNAATGSQVLTLVGHSSGIHSVAFSPDRKYLATGSEDDTAKLWDVGTGAEILTLPGNGAGVTGVAFNPSNGGTTIAVASGITRLFRLNIEDLLALAYSRVTRSFTPAECRRYLHVDQCPPFHSLIGE